MFRVKFVLEGETIEETFDRVENEFSGILIFWSEPDSHGKSMVYKLKWDQIISIEQIDSVPDIIERIKPGTIFSYTVNGYAHPCTAIKAEDGEVYFIPDRGVVKKDRITQVYVPIEKLNPK